jgi:hypothetical protein
MKKARRRRFDRRSLDARFESDDIDNHNKLLRPLIIGASLTGHGGLVVDS